MLLEAINYVFYYRMTHKKYWILKELKPKVQLERFFQKKENNDRPIQKYDFGCFRLNKGANQYCWE